MSLVRCLRRAGARQLATATFAKAGPPAQVVTLGPDGAAKAVGDSEVAIKIWAAPVSPVDLGTIQGNFTPPPLPAVPGTEGVGVVTAIGSKVSGLSVGDWVVPTVPGFGTWRPSAVAKATDVMKVPSDIPVEFAANLHSALTALRLLEDAGLKAGDFIVQDHADSAVGLSVIQIAKVKGIGTINVLPTVRPGYFDTAELIKNLGADVIMRESYLGTPEYARLVADLPKPKLGITGGGDASKLKAALGSGAPLVAYSGSSTQPAAGSKTFSMAEWLKKASPAEKAKAVEEVAALFRSEALRMWVERHPLSDITYALKEAGDPYKTRRVVLVINEEEKVDEFQAALKDLPKLQSEFEAAFAKLRA